MASSTSSRAVASTADLRDVHLLRALRLVHTSPQPLSRADLARRLGCVRATAAALVGDLERLGLVQEGRHPMTGRRGRPSAVLGAAEGGPVVVALEIAPEAVRVAHVPVTGGLENVQSLPLESHDVAAVLDTARAVLTSRLAVLGTRVAGVGVAMHGLVDRADGLVLSAPGFGWSESPVDVLTRLGLTAGDRVLIGNVATLIALAEAVRGRACQTGTVLVLHAGVGLGGALLVHGRPVTGRRGLAGEYGHAPFGVEDLICRCGARGCWETEVDRVAVARMAGLPTTPQTAKATAAAVMTDGRNPAAAAAIRRAATSLGRGIGALVAVHDPDLVVLTAHTAELHATASDVVAQALAASGARHGAPPVVAGELGADAGLVGAAEAGFDVLLSDLALLTSKWKR